MHDDYKPPGTGPLERFSPAANRVLRSAELDLYFGLDSARTQCWGCYAAWEVTPE